MVSDQRGIVDAMEFTSSGYLGNRAEWTALRSAIAFEIDGLLYTMKTDFTSLAVEAIHRDSCPEDKHSLAENDVALTKKREICEASSDEWMRKAALAERARCLLQWFGMPESPQGVDLVDEVSMICRR